MSSKTPRSITPANPGLLRDIVIRLKLILRLMADGRVSPFLKLLPIGAVIYAIWPIDIPGPIDDAAVLWLGTFMFVELCPPNVVQEHINQLKATPPVDWADTHPGAHPDGEVVDAEYRETGEARSQPEEMNR